jgi:hypothetical protein
MRRVIQIKFLKPNKEDVEDVKEHIRENRTTYIACGVTAVVIAGFTWVVMRSNTARGVVGDSGARGVPTNTASFNFRNKQTVNVTTVLDREGSGHPGWPVRNLETKRIFFSQKDAAKTYDIPESVLSAHLKGKFQDVDGLHFERVSLDKS